MSNSSLVKVTKLSPNCNSPRNNKILKITPHHTAGVATAMDYLNMFANPSRGASANYVIGSDHVIGLCVDEANRAWTSGSQWNDNQAITIEVANDGGADTGWHVSDENIELLVQLMVDICKRNGISSLNWTGDANGNLTCHYMFQATACPGDYLHSKMPWLAQEVNKRLGGAAPTPAPAPQPSGLAHNVGEVVSFNKLYASSTTAKSVVPAVTSGTITRIVPGTANPYLIDNVVGWVNDACITSGSTPAPQPAPQPAPSTGHSVGDQVSFNKIYTSSTSTEPLTPAVTYGMITNIIAGAHNPYLINGGTGWINDGCITNGSSPAPAPQPTPAPAPSTGHSVGETVSFNAIYVSSTSTEPLPPAVTSGTITQIAAGTHNPYLINNGTGWVNDSCIIGGGSAPAPAPAPAATITTGSNIKIKSGARDLNNGLTYASFVYDKVYIAMEVNGNRVAFGDGSTYVGATDISNCYLV